MNRLFLATAAITAAFGCSSALAAPTQINLRIEGASSTVYEGPVTTDGRAVKGHPCDGTSSVPPQSPGATVGAGLDDAAAASGFTWDGTWSDSAMFGGDFFISRIGPDTAAGGNFWGVFRNERFTDFGACQQLVSAGDRVVFALGDGSGQLLELLAPSKAPVGQPFDVLVFRADGMGGRTPAAGANVLGATSGADGRATVKIGSTSTFKATRAGDIRSNAASVCGFTPSGGECDNVPFTGLTLGGSAAGPQARDSKAPVASISSLRNGQRFRKGRGPKLLAGRVVEDVAIQQVYLRLTRRRGGRCAWFSGRREVFTRGGSCRKARFIRIGDAPSWSYQLPARLGKGFYKLEVKALDRSQNADREHVKFRVAG